MTYEFIQVDGYVDEKGNTGWNDCTVLGTFETTEGQLRRNFRKQLAKVGVAFDRKKHQIGRYGEWDENLELEERESEVALFAAVTYEKRDAADREFSLLGKSENPRGRGRQDQRRAKR